jgi:hypothetical protein
MGPVNWMAVVVSALVAGLLAYPCYGLWRVSRMPSARSFLAMLFPAALIGHNFARLGAEALAAKPKLYWMMSGGWALAIIIPVGVVLYSRHALRGREAMADATYVLVAFMAMGTVFWAMG